MATVTAMPRAIGDGENLLAEEREKRGQEEDDEEDWLRITLSSFSHPPDLWVFFFRKSYCTFVVGLGIRGGGGGGGG